MADNTKPVAYSSEQKRNMKRARKGIIDYYKKKTGERPSERTINNVLGNIHVETSFLTQNHKREGAWEYSDIQNATANYRSMKGNLSSWGGSKEEYDKLSNEQKLSVMYYGDLKHEKYAGGSGALQMTSANFGGIENTYQEMERASKSLGLSGDNFYESTQIALDIFESRGQSPTRADSASAWRGSAINPGEDQGQLKPSQLAGLNMFESIGGLEFDAEKASSSETIDEMTEGKKKEVIADFEKRNKEISEMDLTQGQREAKRRALHAEMIRNGYDGIINENIEESQQERAGKVEAHKELVSMFDDAQVNYYDKDGKRNIVKDIRTAYTDPDKIARIKEAFPELAEYMHVQEDRDTGSGRRNGKHRIVINQKASQGRRDTQTIPKFLDQFNAVGTDIYGEEYKDAYARPETDDSGITKGLDAHPGPLGNISKFFNDVKSSFVDTMDRTGEIGMGSDVNSLAPQQKIFKIDREQFEEEEIYQGAPTVDTGKRDKKESSSSNGGVDPKREPEEIEEQNAAEQYYKGKLGLADADLKGANAKMGATNTKRELPIDAVTGMALGLIGNEEAKNANIPLRTEQVSEAVKQYTSQLKKRSEEGLPAEVEANMRNQLAEVYQGGLQTIVNSSGGNRATVLGNQGQLETARSKGLVDIQMADYEAKEKAFQQYGQALQYMNSFDANREQANHAIKYRQGLLEQQEGKQLATAGFEKLTSALKYDRENGPGSVNDMMRSQLEQEIFGFDSKKKDDGTGTEKGTKSLFDRQKANKKEAQGLAMSQMDKFNSLNPEQKQLAHQARMQNGNGEALEGLTNFLYENPDTQVAEMDVSKLGEAHKSGDYGLLGGTAPVKEEAVAEAPQQKNQIIKDNPLESDFFKTGRQPAQQNTNEEPIIQSPEQDPFTLPGGSGGLLALDETPNKEELWKV